MADKEEKPNQPEASPVPRNLKLILVLVTVFIVCGGNGTGFIAAALIWKHTGNIAIAIGVLIGITVFALAAALLVLFAAKHSLLDDRQENHQSPAEQAGSSSQERK